MYDRTSRYADQPARPGARSAVFQPEMDVIEQADGMMIMFNLPGVRPDQIDIEVQGNLLTISGTVNEPSDKAARYHARERRTGTFKRTLRLADTLDAQHVEAKYHNGVLTLHLPKVPDATPKRIAVQMA